MGKLNYCMGQQMSSLININPNTLLQMYLYSHVGDPNDNKITFRITLKSDLQGFTGESCQKHKHLTTDKKKIKGRIFRRADSKLI